MYNACKLERGGSCPSAGEQVEGVTGSAAARMTVRLVTLLLVLQSRSIYCRQCIKYGNKSQVGGQNAAVLHVPAAVHQHCLCQVDLPWQASSSQ